MRRKVPMKSGEEYDALTKYGKRFLAFQRGERKRIKKAFNKRERKALKKEIDISEE